MSCPVCGQKGIGPDAGDERVLCFPCRLLTDAEQRAILINRQDTVLADARRHLAEAYHEKDFEWAHECKQMIEAIESRKLREPK